MINTYETGQMVTLISGGPEMTVREYSPIQRGYQCQWFAGKKLEQGYFPGDSLKLVLPPAKE
ncbi:hypothetical protein GCM10011328_05900 [Hafnia psychrotolerans]|uniref:DUF2158 domain-containing protein n=2 Tax=Hafnia psychrotolerans TaxID=1477018 RepID=A0ABQ1FYD2_9GAMM|nr:hypothetical protein GCM10011328_05900 [Hafnia psychrotolerans]